MQAAVNTDETRDFNIHSQLHLAVAKPERVGPAFAQGVADWIAGADAAADTTRTHPDDQDRQRAAYVVLRHGSNDTVDKHGRWAIDTLIAAAGQPHDPFGTIGKHLEYNPAALAFAGLAHKRTPSDDLTGRLLRLAASKPLEASVGAKTVSNDIAALNPRLSKALVRTAFVAGIKPRPSRRFDEATDEAARSAHADAVGAHVETELAWLQRKAPEPACASFPVEQPRKRRSIRLVPYNTAPQEFPPQPSDMFVDERVPAAWIELLHPLCRGADCTDVIGIAHAYQPYSSTRNGAGLERHADVDGYLHGDWNDAYHALLAELVHVLTPEQLDAACRAITDLPDRSFLDVAPNLLGPLHALYFAGDDLEAQIIKVRAAFATRLFATSQWKNHLRTPMGGIETHLGYAIPPLLFGYYVIGRSGCSLGPDNIDRVLPLLPGTSPLIKAGPTIFTAGLALSLLEIKADARLLPFAIEIAEAMLAAHPNDTAFWTDYVIGQRWCRWLDSLHAAEPASLAAVASLHVRVHAVLGRLANIGVAEAAALERKLLP